VKASKRARCITAVCVLLALAFVIGFSLYGPRPSFPVPTPNGYDGFVHAAELGLKTLENAEVRRISDGLLSDATAEELRTWMLQAADTLVLFQQGLTNSCCVPVQATRQFGDSHIQTLGGLKFLTRFLVARARLGVLENRTDDALLADLEAYHFARQIANGGLMNDYLLSLSCQDIVLKHIESLIPSLNHRQCADALLVLESGRDEETPASIVSRQIRWERAIDPTALANARIALWTRTIIAICKTRSRKPLDDLPQRRLAQRQTTINRTLQSVRQRLSQQQETK
jgi:hypothetical protein